MLKSDLNFEILFDFPCFFSYMLSVDLIMPPPSVTGELYCFPRRQLIFSFGRRVIYHLKGL